MVEESATYRLLVLTGDGKGKTTSALGTALRALGRGMRVHVLHFVKDDTTVGEARTAASLPGLSVEYCGRGFVPKPASSRFADHCRAAREGLERARQIIEEASAGLLVLDELCVAVSLGLVSESDALDVLRLGRERMHLVVTGRGAPASLIELADTVTELRNVKHAFSTGRSADEGIEH